MYHEFALKCGEKIFSVDHERLNFKKRKSQKCTIIAPEVESIIDFFPIISSNRK